jgi:hypothetical protein
MARRLDVDEPEDGDLALDQHVLYRQRNGFMAEGTQLTYNMNGGLYDQNSDRHDRKSWFTGDRLAGALNLTEPT